ncbi:biotin synthase [Tepidicella baoligensis]|uniref:biotin synthase n=1 Tax=Tepidicella baoligensis TaxID=2707016 RepID=UPI0015D9F450|nr:biotin synthase [Tepidicella baoligensis]
MTDATVPGPVPDLDPVAARRWREWPRASSPWLSEEVGRRMASRLDWIRQRPAAWVDWNPVLGGVEAHRTLAARYPEAPARLAGDEGMHTWRAAGLIALGPEGAGRPWWRRWLGGASASPRSAPPEPGQADLLWANLSLHLYEHPMTVLQSWYQWLRTDGFVMFSCLGPDTLIELRRAYASKGWPPPLQPMTDMHDWGDMLVQVGFAEPVMDMERLTLTYPDAERLLADLRAGGRNLHRHRRSGLSGRGHAHAVRSLLEQSLPRNPDGQLCVTVEVIYGHAVKPAPRARLSAHTQVPLDDMRAMLRRPPDAGR